MVSVNDREVQIEMDKTTKTVQVTTHMAAAQQKEDHLAVYHRTIEEIEKMPRLKSAK